MIENKEIESALAKTYEDYRLSKSEKQALSHFFKEIDQSKETHAFVRNKAFELVKQQFQTSGKYHYESVKWLEQVIKTLDSNMEHAVKTETAAYFCPGINCLDKIISLIRSARRSIDVCVFTISDDKISKELIKAHEAGIKVRVISDNDKSNDLGSDIAQFAEKGMLVKVDNTPSHMHHKFAIFDNVTLVNGSFNWTVSASRYNSENIVVMNDPKLLKQFKEAFAKLWDECIDYMKYKYY